VDENFSELFTATSEGQPTTVEVEGQKDKFRQFNHALRQCIGSS
jgi:hypothetical protein